MSDTGNRTSENINGSMAHWLHTSTGTPDNIQYSTVRYQMWPMQAMQVSVPLN